MTGVGMMMGELVVGGGEAGPIVGCGGVERVIMVDCIDGAQAGRRHTSGGIIGHAG